ncbi:MAG: CHAT domain-containing protein, partial [Acidobacteria bacterium]|nr:CHAT domain-containing protein [Acidobacteriota bacterium]
ESPRDTRQRAGATAAALRRAGDPWAGDVVAALDRTLGSGSDGADRAVRSWRRWKDGVGLIVETRQAEAARALGTALSALERDFGPLVLRARRDLFLAEYSQTKYDAALRALAPALDADRAARYPYVHADALRLAGLVSAIRGEHGQAFAFYEAALEPTTRSGDPALEAATFRTIADTLMTIEESDQAWKHLWLGFERLHRVDSGPAHYAFYQAAQGVAVRSGQSHLALLFADATVPLAAGVGPANLAGALRLRAETFSRLGATDAALEDVRVARLQNQRIKDLGQRRSVSADLDLAEARVLATVRPEEALELLEKAVRGFDQTEYAIKLPEALLLEARSYGTLKDWDQAETTILRGLDEVQAQLGSLGTLDPLPLSTQRLDLYNELVRLRLGAGNGETRGLEAADAALSLPYGKRLARSLGLDEAPAIAAELAAAVPEGSHALVYWVDDDELCIWSVRPEQTMLRRVPVPKRELEDQIAALDNALTDGSSGSTLTTSSEDLYRTLISPVADLLVDEEPLQLVAGKPLADLPFSLLRDPETGRILLEDHALSSVPSLGFLRQLEQRNVLRSHQSSEPDALRLTATGEVVARAQLNVAVIASTTPDEDRHSQLPILPALSTEVAAIEDSFGPDGTLSVVDGTSATKTQFLEATRHADVLYYLGHAEAPTGEAPRLVLAGPEDLTPDDLLALAPDGPDAPQVFHPGLVILSACATAATTTHQDLPSAFLNAGANTVLANLWPVTDQPSAELMGEVARYLALGLTPAEALRKAQLEARDKGVSVRVWGAGRVVGE